MTDDSQVDVSVLTRARAGDRQAHATLYRVYSALVFTVALRMLGSRAAAEDVVQDSFVEVIRKAGDYRGDGDIRSWIKRIAINKTLSHLRSPWISRRSGMPDEDAVGDADAGPSSARTDIDARDDLPLSLGRQQELERALAALSPTARSVVWLHDVEGYTHREIGRAMRRSASFSKSQLARAYRDLREHLGSEASDRGTGTCLVELKTV